MKRARDGEYIKAFSQLLLVDAMVESRAAKGACSAFLAVFSSMHIMGSVSTCTCSSHMMTCADHLGCMCAGLFHQLH
jgi:hypothetical protein